MLLWGSLRRHLLASSSLCCHAAFISASTPGPAHQPCAPRGRLERGASSAVVESMTSTMSVAMSLMQMPSGVDGSAATIAFASWHRRIGSAINRLRSAVFGVSLVLSVSFYGLVPTCEGCGLPRIRNCDPILVLVKGADGYLRSESVDGPPDLSGFSLNVLAPCYGWRFGTCRTRHFWGCKIKCLLSYANPSSSLPFSLSTSRHMRPTPCCLLPHLPHLSSLSWRSHLLKRRRIPARALILRCC